MARILDSESSKNDQNNLPAQKYVQSVWNFDDEVLVAGTKVISKLGGPSMIIIGFCEGAPPPDASFSTGLIKWKNHDGSLGQMVVYPKILANVHRKSTKDLGLYGDSFPDCFYYKGLNDDKPSNSGVAQAIVKYWSKKADDFVHSVVSLTEIELDN